MGILNFFDDVPFDGSNVPNFEDVRVKVDQFEDVPMNPFKLFGKKDKEKGK